jgi:hypothetical protein
MRFDNKDHKMMPRDRSTPQLGKNGLALIRLVISSYFIAISLGIISGVNAGIVFELWFPPNEAHFIGASIMAGCSLFIFAGMFLRLSCLYLAVLVLSSTIAENILAGGLHNLDGLWRDVVMACVLILIYGSMSRHAMRRMALVRPTQKVRSAAPGGRITPRRVSKSQPFPAIPDNAPQIASLVDLKAIRSRFALSPDQKDQIEFDIPNIFRDEDRLAS